MNQPSVESWQAETLRMTLFLSPTAKLEEQNWWEEVVGEKPENTNYQPRISAYQANGQLDAGQLALQTNPSRIDWLFTPHPTNVPPEKIPTIGSFIETTDRFVSLLLSWLQTKAPDVVRLAFGAVLLRPTENRETGYLEISSYLPFDIDSSNSSDFMYQINRLRPSKVVDNLMINRLTKWSIGRLAWARQDIAFVAPPRIANTLYAGRLELDINTSQEYQLSLPQAELGKLFVELVALGKEIATEGDIQ